MIGKPHRDADALLVRRTALRVGVWITIAASILVLVVLVAAFTFVFTQVPVSDLLDRSRDRELVDVEGSDIIVGGAVIGILAIALAGTLGLLATRRAVAPLVDALRRQRRFVADASHELRTPLAILDTRLQVLQRSMSATDPHRGLVEELRVDTRNVINVVNDLLDAVDVTEGGVAAPIPVGPVIADAVAAMRTIGEERQVSVRSAAVDAALTAAIPETSLLRSLLALLDNAVKHSPPNGTVTVTASAEKGWVLLTVADDGAGIRGIDPRHVFDRFARSSHAVDGGGSASTGFGIGLSLVQDTVGRFGGSVEVVTTSEAGTTFALRLPRPKR